MSTLENKFEFKDDLIASFIFQNTMQAQSSETQEMHVPIVNNSGDGYDLVTKTPYGSNPEFDFNLILSAISTTLFKYASDKFIFNKNVEVPTPVNNSDATTKNYVDTAIGGVVVPSTIVLQGDVTGSGVTGTPFSTTLNKTLNQISNAGDIDIATHKILNVVDPTTNQGVATKNYVDNKTWTASSITDLSATIITFRLDQFSKPTSSIDLNSQKILNLSNPSGNNDATNKIYVDTKTWTASQITDFSTAVTVFRLDQFSAPTSSLNLNSQKIQNLQTPSNPNDGATKNYVDLAIAGVSGGMPIGAIAMWSTSTAPSGWLECDGSAISRTTYALLFAVIGTNFGSGDGSTTFNLPESRGLFPRGWNHSSTRADPYKDPDATSRVAAETGGLTGDQVGTLQADAFASHTHTFKSAVTFNAGGVQSQTMTGNSGTGQSTGSAGGNETRPVNFSVMFIIKAF